MIGEVTETSSFYWEVPSPGIGVLKNSHEFAGQGCRYEASVREAGAVCFARPHSVLLQLRERQDRAFLPVADGKRAGALHLDEVLPSIQGELIAVDTWPRGVGGVSSVSGPPLS